MQLVDEFEQTFFKNRSEFHQESKYVVNWKVWFRILSE